MIPPLPKELNVYTALTGGIAVTVFHEAGDIIHWDSHVPCTGLKADKANSAFVYLVEQVVATGCQ